MNTKYSCNNPQTPPGNEKNQYSVLIIIKEAYVFVFQNNLMSFFSKQSYKRCFNNSK